MSHPLIADAAVVGVTDEEAGQLPLAFVVKKVGGDALTATDVLQYVAGRFTLIRLHLFVSVPTSPRIQWQD